MSSGIKAQIVNIRTLQPINGATAAVGGPSSNKTTTNEMGSFEFTSLPPGNNYTLDISASGYDVAHFEDIVVIEGVVTDLQKLMLWPSE